MSICIPAGSAQGLSAAAFGHFGSAPYFVVHDPETDTTEVLENANAHYAHGGCRPVAAFEGRGIDTLIVGGIGRRAIERLNGSGIRVFRAVVGTVAENLEGWNAGHLEELTPDAGCAGHGG